MVCMHLRVCTYVLTGMHAQNLLHSCSEEASTYLSINTCTWAAGLQTDHVQMMKEVERGMIAFYQDNKGVKTQKLDTEPRGPASAVAQHEATARADQVSRRLRSHAVTHSYMYTWTDMFVHKWTHLHTVPWAMTIYVMKNVHIMHCTTNSTATSSKERRFIST
jgi:hypothetical protein